MTDFDNNCTKNNNNKMDCYGYITICEIISELAKTELDELLNTDDVNVSYETFVNKLTDIYNKNGSIFTGRVNNK